jgi:hypothetical protein
MTLFGDDSLTPSEPFVFAGNDRISGWGKTGSGKSTGMKVLVLQNLDRFVFYDDKREEFRKMDLPVIRGPEQAHEAMFAENPEERLDKFCYVPENSSDEDEFNEICRYVYEHRNHFLYMDELMGVYSDVGNVVKYHGKIMTEGRGRGVGIAQNSQRPRHVPLRCFSESEHHLCWYLKHSSDRDHMEGIIDTTAETIANLGEYEFVYDHDKLKDAEVCPPVDIP